MKLSVPSNHLGVNAALSYRTKRPFCGNVAKNSSDEKDYTNVGPLVLAV
jgi:hypothetical protein